MNGISFKRLNETIQALYENGLHGYVLMRHGQVISEGWVPPYKKEGRHLLFSLTKSFTSIAMGFLAQEGKITVEDKVVGLFPEAFEGRPCENMEKMRIKDLLMMATGHVKEPDIFPGDGQTALNCFLHSYVPKTPGTHFFYNTAATGMAAYIIEKVTGEHVDDYLKPRLFEPLGISNYRWQKLPDGVCTGGFGLSLSAGDFAKFGQFLLQKGVWEGRQLLSAEWISDATSAQIIQQDGSGDWGAGYGYQFWRNRRDNSFRGDGAFGQFCVVLPEKDIVWASSSGSADIGKQLDVLFEKLFAFVDKDADEQGEVTIPMIPCVQGEKSSPLAIKHSGVTYDFPQTQYPDMTQSLRLDFGDNTVVTLGEQGQQVSYGVGYGAHVCTRHDDSLFKNESEYLCAVCASGAWQSEDTYRLQMVHTFTPFISDITVRFLHDAVEVRFQQNVGFDNKAITLYGIRKT